MLSSNLAIGLLVFALRVVVIQMRRRTALAEAEAARRTGGPERRVPTGEADSGGVTDGRRIVVTGASGRGKRSLIGTLAMLPRRQARLQRDQAAHGAAHADAEGIRQTLGRSSDRGKRRRLQSCLRLIAGAAGRSFYACAVPNAQILLCEWF